MGVKTNALPLLILEKSPYELGLNVEDYERYHTGKATKVKYMFPSCQVLKLIKACIALNS